MIPERELLALTTLLQDVSVQLQRAAHYYAEQGMPGLVRREHLPAGDVGPVCIACGLPLAWDQPYVVLVGGSASQVGHPDFTGCIKAAEALCMLAFETVRYTTGLP